MKKIALAALPIAALVALAGCTSAAPAPAPAGGGAASGGASSAPAPAPAPKKDLPAPGSEVDKDAYGDKMIAAVKGVKTVTSTSESSGTIAGKAFSSKATTVSDLSDPAHVKSATESESDGKKMQTVFDGPILYMNDGSGWTKRDTSQPKSGGIQFPVSNPGDLEKMYTKYKESLQKVVYVGESTVDGVAASQYKVTMTVGSSDTTADVYLDAQNRPVQTVIEMGDGKSTTKLGKFNEPVKITIPTDAKEA